MPIEVTISFKLSARKEDGEWEEYTYEDTLSINASSGSNVPKDHWDAALRRTGNAFLPLVPIDEEIDGRADPIRIKYGHCEYIHCDVLGKTGVAMEALKEAAYQTVEAVADGFDDVYD